MIEENDSGPEPVVVGHSSDLIIAMPYLPRSQSYHYDRSDDAIRGFTWVLILYDSFVVCAADAAAEASRT